MKTIATELEKLTELFSKTFEGFNLNNSRAAEWIDEFGYKASVTAIKIASERKCDDPLKYTYGILRSRQKEAEPTATPKSPVSNMQFHYQKYISTGNLTEPESEILIQARNGEKVDKEELFKAEFSLRKAVYFNPIHWLPEYSPYWEKIAWLHMTTDEKKYATRNDIQERGEIEKQRWQEIMENNPETIARTFDTLYMMGESKPETTDKTPF